MLKDLKWPNERFYKTGGSNEPLEFYMESLCNSTRFDLLLGYFSSAAINLLSIGFAHFIFHGGRLRIIANNILSMEDREAIIKGKEKKVVDNILDLSSIGDLKFKLDDYGKHFFECLAFLIANDRIDFRIIRPKKGRGISHYKNGIFHDGKDYVSFSGSCNFTAFGLVENLERLDVFLGWENSRSSTFTNSIRNEFENIFSGKDQNVDYLNEKDIQIAFKTEFGDKTIQELLIQEKELIEKKKTFSDSETIKNTFDRISVKIDSILREPKFPFGGEPREYQKDAYDSWVNNDFKGIFAMATGTGKTITSLNCLLNEYKKSGSYKAIITVPTTALVEQWELECKKFNFRNIIKISSKTNWNQELSFFNTADKFFRTSYIVIVTYASFGRPKFQSHFIRLPIDTIFIADEVHNLGATSLKKILPKIHLQKRIGLSATPNRQFDEIGNLAIEQFFNDKEPFIVSYSMKEALSVGWLCPYTYYPHIVELKDDEFEEYIRISKQLFKYIDPKTNQYKKEPEVERLLLKRKRIIHKAKNKLSVFENLIKDEFAKRKNLKYTLVYVPEGLEPDYSRIDIDYESDDDLKLINEYTKIVSTTHNSIMVRQFTSQSKNREEILRDFETGNVHVLTSMKCLDEGVDVPRSELAIFCSSTGNPRQFIQRRGRVLRLSKGKIHATIHDLVVIPQVNKNEDYFDMEKSLVKKELERVVDFSSLALNKMDTYQTLNKILDYYNLNLYDL